MNFTFLGASLLLALPVTLTRGCSAGDKAKEAVHAAVFPPHDTLQRPLPDGISLWADVYRLPTTGNEAVEGGKPVLVCMHMTASSRGEYGRLAAEMMALGVNVMSVDLRCGGEGEIADRKTGVRSGTMNETWKQAKAVLGHNPTYLEAYPDVVAAVAWAKELFPYSRIGLVGSSYSASFALVYAAENPTSVDVAVAMSPGEYMPPWVIREKIQHMTVPSYITCGNTPADTNQAQPVASAILDQTRVRTFWPEDHNIVGDHGSHTLLIGGEVNHKRQWAEFERGIAPVLVPLTPAELERRRAALKTRTLGR
jgi:pimeloyl-ACP methyl ester carboxylesterase